MTPLSRDRLVEMFRGYGRSRSNWLVGGEFERHLLRPDGTPVPFSGPFGVEWLLNQLVDEGWEAEREGPHTVAALGAHSSVTLEPGAQFELSGAPFADATAVQAEADQFTRRIDAIIQETGAPIHQVAIGYTPFARLDEIQWVPKGRYVIMREYLQQTGSLAHHMMKGTCAVQASYDFSDEEDAARKVRLSTLLGPLTTALFANSPIREGRFSGYMSWRGHIWTQVDPRRTGFPDAAENFSFERWVDYLLQVPMMFFKDAEGRWAHAHGRTFGDWLESENPPGIPEWDLHLTSVFPEVRIKRTIEVRGGDCVPQPLAMSFVALFKGLFYCDQGLAEGTELARALASHGTKEQRFAEACKEGLEGVIGGRRLADWGAELLDIADGALQRCAPGDRPLLEPLKRQVERGESPARTLLRHWDRAPTFDTLLKHAHILSDDG